MTEEYEQYKREQAKDYLNRVRYARRRIRALEAEIDYVRDMATSIGAVDYSDVSVSTSPSADAIPNTVARLDELVRKRAEEAAFYAEMITECGIALESMGGWEADLLRMHYIAGIDLVDIGKVDEWKHDRQYMSVLHLQALSLFFDHMPHYRKDPTPSAV